LNIMKKQVFILSAFLLLLTSTLLAKGVGVSGGSTLLEAPSARAAALGEAFSAFSNDISAFAYNPASLNSLHSGHASILYQQGFEDESFGQLLLGSPVPKGSLGLSVGIFNGGEIELFDGVSKRTVTAQRDMILSLGFARNVGRASIGLTGKYISSELGEIAKANAFAGDIGLQIPLLKRLRIGAALQNIGTQLKFATEGDELPRIARLGMEVSLFSGERSTSLLMDAPYFMNEAEIRPALGIETHFGPLSFRAGYKTQNELEGFSFGTGFLISQASMDYAFGFSDEVASQHRISLSMRFNGFDTSSSLVKEPRTNQNDQMDLLDSETFSTTPETPSK